MSRVITFSRYFPKGHPRQGQPTFFVEQILNSLGYARFKKNLFPEVRSIVNDFVIIEGETKHHTIRKGNRWKTGDKFSPRIWSGKPYQSKQIIIAPDIHIKKVFGITIYPAAVNGQVKHIGMILIDGQPWFDWHTLAENDGLSVDDMESWLLPSLPFNGQIICWNDDMRYETE